MSTVIIFAAVFIIGLVISGIIHANNGQFCVIQLVLAVSAASVLLRWESGDLIKMGIAWFVGCFIFAVIAGVVLNRDKPKPASRQASPKTSQRQDRRQSSSTPVSPSVSQPVRRPLREVQKHTTKHPKNPKGRY